LFTVSLFLQHIQHQFKNDTPLLISLAMVRILPSAATPTKSPCHPVIPLPIGYLRISKIKERDSLHLPIVKIPMKPQIPTPNHPHLIESPVHKKTNLPEGVQESINSIKEEKERPLIANIQSYKECKNKLFSSKTECSFPSKVRIFCPL